MFEQILVPTDGSTGTAHVALHAFDIADRYGATVHALSVIERAPAELLSEVGGGDDAAQRRAENAVSTIERMGEGHGVEVRSEIREGKPADEILRYADETGADLLVTGTHGRSGVRRHLLGSVAERVVRHANCPVMTVRLPDTDVTVENEAQARELVEDALAGTGYDATIESVSRQLSVWVAEADGGDEDGRIVVYLDPETQRTSVLPQ